MKKGDINLLSIGLNNIYSYRSPFGVNGSSLIENISPEILTRIIKKEKIIQDFLSSLVPRKTILVISERGEIGGVNIWKDCIFLEIVDIECRTILIEEISTGVLHHVSAYGYGTALFTLDEYNKFVI